MTKIRPRAKIIRTIGDQLVSGPEAALIELVKNSFDADSPSVAIKITPRDLNSKEPEFGMITVIDTGHGMSLIDLTDKWFEPATTDKVERRLSPNGRIMLGAKGVGRFASARLGTNLYMKTARKISDNTLEASEIVLDWTIFEKKKYLDEVDIAIATKIIGVEQPSGVSLEISSLRDQWTKSQLEVLIRELRRLASPLRTREDRFSIYLDLSDFKSDKHGFDGKSLLAGLTASPEEVENLGELIEITPLHMDNVYHYMVQGSFDGTGRFNGTFVNQRGDGKIQKIELPENALTFDEQYCGDIELRLNIYDREGEAVVELFEKLGLGAIGRLDAKRILDENIGIGIYREGFRIRPYGDAETDWLELERMRVQNPSKKLGLNQVWGVVNILDERMSGLIERSSREGLEHNGAFQRLKRMVAGLLTYVESIRYDFRQTVGLSRKTSGDTSEVRTKADMAATAIAVASLPKKYRGKVEQAMKRDAEALKTSIAELETYQQALASNSTLGLVVAQVLHDGRRFLSDISTRSKRLNDGAPRLLEESVFGTHFRETFGKEAGSVNKSSTELSKLFKLLDPISGKKKGRAKNFDLDSVIVNSLSLFSDVIKNLDIKIIFDFDKSKLQVFGHESDLMAALLNIVDNAIHWLGTSSNSRILNVKSVEADKYVRLIISNNGPLISDRFIPNLFSPGFSLKSEGSGIGLAIAREAMRASKGDVAYDKNGNETTFVIEMQKAKNI
jgi:signal transduction histidine kinase